MKQLLTIILVVLAVPLFAVELKPANVEQGFVEPNTESTFRFNAVDGNPESTEFRILDAWGKPVKTEQAVKDGNSLSLKTTLSQGFWEIEFPATKQRFGVVSLPAFQGKPDPFFAIDGALSWLVGDDAMREGLVKSAKRCGIGMIRERLTWGAVESKEGAFQWETDRRYEKLRNVFKANDVEVLEMFHDAPAWTGKIEKYPDDLIKTAKSWETIAKHWSPTWGAFEIWNEPEISFGAELPADQYVPMAKAITYQLKKAGIKTPVYGGVMAHFEKDWLATAAENGLLDVVDGFSFHTYDRAPGMQRIAEQYRDWLTKYGHASMPLWLTECGRPWKKGPKRPEITEDWASAVDIVMKGVESRCNGVDRYFPFVYPYYEENDNNFGMMDKLGTPARSFAAYVQMIRMLSDTKYIGDLKTDDPAILRARLFGKGNETVLVVYTGKLAERKSWKIPDKAIAVETATGEPLVVAPDMTIPLESESMVYVRLERSSNPSGSGRTISGVSNMVKPLSPIVLRYQFDRERVATMPQGYSIKRTEEKTLPLKIRVFNLGTKTFTSKLRFSASDSLVEEKGVSVPAEGFADVVWNLPLAAAELVRGESLIVKIDADGHDRLVLSFKGEATWDGVTSTVKNVTEIPIGEMKRWNKNAAAICTVGLEKPKPEENAVWRMFATFGEGDRWVYPRFDLPKEIDLSQGDGLILHARAIGDTRACFMLFEQNGCGYIVSPAIKSDGEWHVVKLPFPQFGHVGATRPDPNGKLDADQVRAFSFGANCTGTNCVLELKKVALYKNNP